VHQVGDQAKGVLLVVCVFSYFVTRSGSKLFFSVNYYGTSVPNRTEETRMLRSERGIKNT